MMRNGKQKVIPEEDIRKDVRVIMPSLDLFGEKKMILDPTDPKNKRSRI